MSSKHPSDFFYSIGRQSALLPDYMAGSITDLTPARLQAEAVSCLILDVDDTLVQRGGSALDVKTISHLQGLRRAGIELIIGSNTNRNIRPVATSIDAQVVGKSWWLYKPMKSFYRQILTATQYQPDQILMVGDKIINDIIGAHRVGLRAILVEPTNRRPGILSKWYRRYLKHRASN